MPAAIRASRAPMAGSSNVFEGLLPPRSRTDLQEKQQLHDKRLRQNRQRDPADHGHDSAPPCEKAVLRMRCRRSR